MASNLFGPGSAVTNRSRDVEQARTEARDRAVRQQAAAAAAGRDRRSIGRKR